MPKKMTGWRAWKDTHARLMICLGQYNVHLGDMARLTTLKGVREHLLVFQLFLSTVVCLSVELALMLKKNLFTMQDSAKTSTHKKR